MIRRTFIKAADDSDGKLPPPFIRVGVVERHPNGYESIVIAQNGRMKLIPNDLIEYEPSPVVIGKDEPTTKDFPTIRVNVVGSDKMVTFLLDRVVPLNRFTNSIFFERKDTP